MQLGFSLRAQRVLGDIGPAAGDLPALAEHTRAVGVFEFDKMMIVNLPVALGIADLPATHALRADRMPVFDPVAHVDVVDVLFDDVIAGKPGEVVPVPNL